MISQKPDSTRSISYVPKYVVKLTDVYLSSITKIQKFEKVCFNIYTYRNKFFNTNSE